LSHPLFRIFHANRGWALNLSAQAGLETSAAGVAAAHQRSFDHFGRPSQTGFPVRSAGFGSWFSNLGRRGPTPACGKLQTNRPVELQFAVVLPARTSLRFGKPLKTRRIGRNSSLACVLLRKAIVANNQSPFGLRRWNRESKLKRIIYEF
jgi:hypothetical protein